MTRSYQTKLLAAAALAAVLAGCGGDKADAQQAEADVKQATEATVAKVDNLADQAAAGVTTAVQEVEEAKRNPKVEMPEPEAAKPAIADLKSDPIETQEQMAASMSQLQQQLTKQLGGAAAAELEAAMGSLKRQADDMLVTSAVDSLSRNLSIANNPGALDSLSQLTKLAGNGKINPVQLNDVASISSASILANAFSGGDTPTLIQNAIDSYTSSKLLSGSKDLFSALNTVDMTASQKQLGNSMLDSLKPLLGTWGDNLDTLRETGGKVNDAASAIKKLF